MKPAGFFLMSAAAALSSCASVPGVQSHPTDESSLRAANAEYDRAILAADAAALGRIYTDDFSFVGDKAELRNKHEQIRYMTNGSLRVLSARSEDIAVTRLGQDHALLTGRFSGRFRAGATEADFVERYSSIWVRQGSRWRLRHEHSSLVP
jgi:ketosteroid isomerase-like protein